LERVNGSAFTVEPPPRHDVIVTAVPHEYLAEEFMRTGALMEKVAQTSRGRFLVEDLFEGCAEGRFILWVAARLLPHNKREYLAVIFTSVRDYPRKRALQIDFVAGTHLSEWMGRFAQVYERMAVAEKCDIMEGGGRMGWLRPMKRIGLKPTGFFFEAEVPHATE
jgi:hypothetical protein